MEKIKLEIQKRLSEIADELGITHITPVVTLSADLDHGDYTTNLALVASKLIKKPAVEIAEMIKKAFLASELFEKVEVGGSGFVNFKISQKNLITHVDTLIKSEKTAIATQVSSKKIVVEFTDPNPFKEFHIGHLYSNTVGEAIARILEYQKAQVKRVCYQGDVGLHVAKALWGILQQFSSDNENNLEQHIEELEQKPLVQRIAFLGKSYALGAAAYEEDKKAKEEITTLNKQIFEKDPRIMPLYEKGKKWSLQGFEEIYERLGTKFNNYYFESEVGEIGKELVLNHLSDGIFTKSEGAIIFEGKKHGLHNRVFINSLGLPTYEAKELGLAPKKYEDFPYDFSVIVTGNEINEYFKVLLKVLSLIRPDLSAKTKHISHGMVRLKSGKMSSRSGNVLTGEWLLNEVQSHIKANYPEMDKEVLVMVGVGAIKYALLKNNVGKDIEFSFEESISLEGNSGPYLQYTYARTQSVLNKAQSRKFGIPTSYQEKVEQDLLRVLYRFDEVVFETSQRYSLNGLCSYLFELAQLFNLFYQKHKILSTEQENQRLYLTFATGEILKKGLFLLGIEAPHKM